MDRKKELLIRAYGVFLAFLCLSVLIMVRVVKVSIYEGDKWREKGNKNVKMRTLKAERGNIYSEDFNLLCTSLKFFDVHMDMTVQSDKLFREKVDSLAYCLAESVGSYKTEREWRNGLLKARREKRQYYPLLKKVTIDEYYKLKKFPILRLSKFRGGLIAEPFSKRAKPYNGFASRTIGEDRENADKVGLEGYFDKFLSGDSTKVLMKRVSALGDEWVPIYDMQNFEPEKGKDIVTTINIDIQDIVHNELLSQVQELEALAATAIVMEVKTGAIRAISNFTRLKNGNYAEVYNYAVAELSEPGSTFKLASMLALLDDGHCTLGSKVDLKGGKMRFHDLTMYDSEMHGLRNVTLKEAFEKSSNVGIARLVNDAYNSHDGRLKFVSKLKDFGLRQRLGIEIQGERAPIVKHPKNDQSKWYGTTIPWMAHGYELMHTPLQVLNLYNTVANGGRMMKPYLVSEVIEGSSTVKIFRPRVLSQQMVKPSVVHDAREALEGVVKYGTGRLLRSAIVDIAGKTGTTRVNYSERSEKKEYNASFAGYFPSHHPKYSMIVVVYRPQGSKYYGASAAGPAFKKIAERITTLSDNLIYSTESQRIASSDLPESNSGYKKDFEQVFEYVGLEYQERKKKANWVKVDPMESEMVIDKKKISKSHVPDVKGMGARDAIYVLENLGMSVEVNGVGKVVKQTIRPGTKNKGQDIKIYLN